MIRYKAVLAVVVLMMLFSCKSSVERMLEDSLESYEIRVKLQTDLPLDVKSRSGLIISDTITGHLIKQVGRNESIKVDTSDDRIVLSGISRNSPLTIRSGEGRLLELNGRQYVGTITIYPRSGSADVINTVPVETYLYSVLPSEVPASFHLEALKAQTVVARTYAWYFMLKYGTSRSFDVDDTTSYQVFKGYEFKDLDRGHLKGLKEAIQSTEGTILTFEGEPFTAFFHANSGGILRSAAEYYGPHADMACFVSKVDPWSLEYPGATWQYEISYTEMKEILGFSTDLTDDNFSFDINGFVTDLEIDNLYLTSRDIRRMIGYTKVRSERFRLYIRDDLVLFDGIGYGHGVGMSQWGAQGMAVRNYSYKEILQFYYPNTVLSFY